MSKQILLRLSWPAKDLSSNARVHHMARARAVKSYRREAHAASIEHGVHRAKDPRAKLTFSFFPPDNRRRDVHNMPHMMKAVIDGIADAMGCDDNQFECVFPGYFIGPVRGGSVLVQIEVQE